MRRWWSGLSQQTVNLSPSGFVGSNPTRRTKQTNPEKGFCFVRRSKPTAWLVCWIRKTFLYFDHKIRKVPAYVIGEKCTHGPTRFLKASKSVLAFQPDAQIKNSLKVLSLDCFFV